MFTRFAWNTGGAQARFRVRVFVAVFGLVERPVLRATWLFLGGNVGFKGRSICSSVLGIAFKSRPQTRIFGSKTAGLATSNASFRLSGGQMMVLTTGKMLDFEKKFYPSGVAGDEHAAADDWQSSEALARQWLLTACRQ